MEKTPVDAGLLHALLADYVQQKGLDFGLLLALADEYYNKRTIMRLAHTASESYAAKGL